MEFSPTGWAACFDNHKDDPVYIPVQRWDDTTGAPMIVATGRNTLVPAQREPDFHGLVEVPQVVTAVVAQPGWRLLTTEEADGQQRVMNNPIVAWAVTSHGRLLPITVELGDGWGEPQCDGRILSPVAED